MKRNLLLAIFSLLTVSFAYGQTNVSGTVTSSEDGEALPGVSVVVKGTVIGTTTDYDGNYTIEVPASYTELIFSYIGMMTKEVEIGSSTTLNVALDPDVLGLDEVVVTAVGIEREKKAIGYSVQDVDGDDLRKANSESFLDAMAGKVAGVQIQKASGAAGASSRVVIRGQTSFNGNNQALILVDGIRYNNSENNTERTLYGVANSNRGMDINPDDIESISVLKGAAATALYGVEGARGVILITTKKGTAKKGLSVSFNSNYTVSSITQMVPLQDKYSQGGTGTWAGADGFDPIWWGGFVRAVSWGARLDTLSYDGSDYKWDKNGRIVSKNDPTANGKAVTPYDNIGNLFQTGTTFTNNVALSGGDEKSNFRLTLGNTNETGVVPLNTYSRTNVGLSAGTKLFTKLDVSGSFSYTQSKGRRIQQGSNTSGLMLGLLRTPVTFDNTNGLSDPVNDPLSYQFPDGSQRNFRGGGGYDNPYWVINNSPYFDRVNRFFGTVRAAYPIHQWLTLSTTLGLDTYTDNRKQEFELGSNTFRGGQVVEDNIVYNHSDIYLQANGSGDLSDNFTLSYNAGINFWNKRSKNNYVQGDGLNFVGFRELSNTQSVTSTISNSNQRNFSAFGSVEFGFKSQLFVTLTGRQDYLSSLIVPTKEFKSSDVGVFYPSASVSWVFSEALKSDAIPYAKVRASFAQVGGGAPGAYLTGTPYVVPSGSGSINSLNDGWTNGISFPYQGSAGFTYSALQGNISLTPSRTTDIELGLDMRFLNNRLGVDFTYYSRKSTDQIIAISIPSSTGFQRAVINSGELSTKGFEIILNTTPVKSGDWRWDVNFNFSTWNTIVESLPEGVPNQYLDGFTGTGVYNIAPEKDENGNVTKKYEYGQILAGAWQRVNDGKGGFDASLPYDPNGAVIIDDSGSPDANDPEYNDNYGFPLVDPINRVLGNPNPDFLLGINSILTWKNLSFDFLIDIRSGGDMWNGTKGALTFFGRTKLTENRSAVVWNDNQGWVHDYDNGTDVFEGVLASNGQPNAIKVPLDENWYSGNGGGFGSQSESFIEDASSTRLAYVRLAYNFKDLITSKFFSDLTLTFTANNIWISTPYEGIDPNTSLVGAGSNGQGLDYFQMPGIKSYALGVNLKF
jgi:TonB-linked SusC/RagA family outer membrane protein